MIILPHYHYWFTWPGDAVITINNSAIVIIFCTTSKLLGKKSQSSIALTLFIEIVDKELLKYKAENIRWWYMTEEQGEKGPIIWQSRFTLVLLQVAFYVKARLRRS